MRARMSFVLAGFGKFVVMTSVFCLAMTIAITGPPTPSETASVSAVIDRAARRVDSAALNLNFDLCVRAPVLAHAAGLCASPSAAVVRKDSPAQPVEVATMSQALPASARDILPPDTIDQINQPALHADLLGDAPRTSRHAAPSARHAHTAARASEHSARTRRAARPSRARGAVVAAHVRHAPVHAARPARVRAAAPTRSIRTTPIAAPRRSPAPTIAVTPSPAPAAAPASEPPAEHEPPAAPEEHAHNPAPEKEEPSPDSGKS